MRDPHMVLGIPANATLEEIKSAFRRLAMQTHPDRGGDPEEFMEVQAAYEALRGQPAKDSPKQPGTSWASRPAKKRKTRRRTRVPKDDVNDDARFRAWIDVWFRRKKRRRRFLEAFTSCRSFRWRDLEGWLGRGLRWKEEIRILERKKLVVFRGGWYTAMPRLFRLVGYLFWRGLYP